MRSIRLHLSAWLLGGMGVLLGACGLGCYLLVGEMLTAQFDEGLVAGARAVAALVEPEVVGVEFSFSRATMPEFAREERPEYFQVWLGAGVELARSPSLGEASLPRREGPPGAPEIWALELPDGRSGRAAGIRFRVEGDERSGANRDAQLELMRQTGLEPGGEVTVVLARDTLELDGTLRALLRGLVIAGGVLAFGTFLLVRRVVASACRPVDELARRIEAMDAESLGEGEPLPAGPAELEAFRERFRDFRRRLAESFEREKRLTSNIAHELRTPIAELRTVTDLVRMWPEDEELHAKCLEDAHAIGLQMDRLLRTCLRLARLQSGQAAVERRMVDVSQLLGELCRQSCEFANGRQLRLEREIPAGCTVRCDPELLELILGNLLDNAFHHAPDGTWVRVAMKRAAEGVAIELANPVDGLDEGELARIEEPFWHREDDGQDGRHLGLGLAMVSSAAGMIGAGLRYRIEEGRFVVDLYLAPSGDHRT